MSLSHRPLDHLVLPVVDLATARLRLSALGFAVAPEARHPFGTENACVYFADSTYLEPIAIADQQIYDQNIVKAEFVRRDRAYRFRNGDDGLSAIVLKSEDAEADHAEFAEAGVGVGDGDRKVIPVTAGRRFGLHHGGLAGGGNGGPGYIGGQQNGWGRKYYISIHGLWPPLQLVKANRQGDQI